MFGSELAVFVREGVVCGSNGSFFCGCDAANGRTQVRDGDANGCSVLKFKIVEDLDGAVRGGGEFARSFGWKWLMGWKIVIILGIGENA